MLHAQWPVASLFQSLMVMGHCISTLISHRRKHVLVLSLCLPVLNPCDLRQKWTKRELSNKSGSATKKPEVITPGEILEWDSNGVIADWECGRCHPGRGSREISEGKALDIHKESSCGVKDDNVPEASKKLLTKGILRDTSQC